MIVENITSVRFTEQEVVSGLLAMMEIELNDMVAGTPEYERRERIVNYFRDSKYTTVDFYGEKFYLMADGVTREEDF